ncbi:MAG: hypothetical protein KGJ13_02085 [Patescibacteria group bacterium]|nr:hypothetical protein [Patescibacteria group bacterium]
MLVKVPDEKDVVRPFAGSELSRPADPVPEAAEQVKPVTEHYTGSGWTFGYSHIPQDKWDAIFKKNRK